MNIQFPKLRAFLGKPVSATISKDQTTLVQYQNKFGDYILIDDPTSGTVKFFLCISNTNYRVAFEELQKLSKAKQ